LLYSLFTTYNYSYFQDRVFYLQQLCLGGLKMKTTFTKVAVLLAVFAAATLMGCVSHSMNGTMDNSGDTMSEEKMDTGMESMQGEEMQNMQSNDMEKTMEKTMK